MTRKFEIRQHDNEVFALGIAISVLSGTELFSTIPVGEFANTVSGQIKRKHYFFTLDVEQNKVVGYAGWALCDEVLADRWLEEDYKPTHEESMQGDCWLGLTYWAMDNEVNKFQTRHMRATTKARYVYWKRVRKDGSIHNVKLPHR